jgi:hypothetical protein
MHICPQCSFASIPAWRAFVVISFLEKPVTCSHCSAQLKLRRGAADALVQVPMAATVILALHSSPVPFGFFLWSLGMATLAAIATWGNFVRYKLVEGPAAFTPHPSTPPRT